ncbi:MAG: transposase [Chloroflexi bacterium]|nr:transposase [Chloroflexota bacterium]
MASPACRELDGVLGLTEALTNLRDTRGGGNVQHQVFPLLRQPIFSRRAGYEDTNDAERLALLNAIEN